jgi:hypothetical protein
VTLNSTKGGDTRREETRLENRWHGMQEHRKGKRSQTAVPTAVKPGSEFDDPIGML